LVVNTREPSQWRALRIVADLEPLRSAQIYLPAAWSEVGSQSGEQAIRVFHYPAEQSLAGVLQPDSPVQEMVGEEMMLSVAIHSWGAIALVWEALPIVAAAQEPQVDPSPSTAESPSQVVIDANPTAEIEAEQPTPPPTAIEPDCRI
jgi:hypothetical protein